MIIGKLSDGDTGEYQTRLAAFIEKYQSSEALDYAKKLLDAIPKTE